MTPPPPPTPDHSTVARLLGDLDCPTFGRFVADLWAFRGWESQFDGDVVHVTDPDGSEGVLLLAHGGGLLDHTPTDLPAGVAPRDVVAVVAPETGPAARTLAAQADADLVGPDDLRRMALYAIDREACDTLFRRYFDCGLGDVGASTTSSSVVSLFPSNSTVRVGASVGVVGLLLILAVSVAGTTLPGLPGLGTSGASVSVDRTTPSTVTPTATATATFAPTPDRSLGCQPTPRATVEETLSAFAANDPETNDGLRRVWDGATAEFRRYSGPFETFVTIMNNYPFAGLLDPATVEYGNATQAGRVARQTVTVRSSSGNRSVYTFTLALEDPDAQGCWSLSGLTYRSQDRPTNATATATPDSPRSPTAEPTTAAVSIPLKNV